MVLAVIITGAFAKFHQVLPSLYENIFAKNDAVLFLACECPDAAEVQRVLAPYPIRVGGVLALPTFRDAQFNAIVQMIKTSARPGVSDAVFRRAMEKDGMCWSFDYVEQSGTLLQYYQFWRAWQTVLAYEKAHSMRFSHCLRARCDIVFSKPIALTDSLMDAAVNPFLSDLYDAGRLHMTSVYFDPLVKTVDPVHTVTTFGTEQTWFGQRDVLERLAFLLYEYGVHVLDHPFAFSSECTFQAFCNAHGIYHRGIVELGWPVYVHSFEEASKYTVTILR